MKHILLGKETFFNSDSEVKNVIMVTKVTSSVD